MKLADLLGQKPKYDRALLLATLLLLGIGVIFVSSASVMEAGMRFGDSFLFLKKQLIAIGIAVFVGVFFAAVPSDIWKRSAAYVLGVGIFSLILVLLIGKEVNEAKRWISLGFMNVQPVEFVKLAWVIYLASYTSRKIAEVRHQLKGFIKPWLLILVLSPLLLMQPDFGSLAVITGIAVGVLFAAGAGLLKYIVTVGLVGISGALLTWLEPYRMRRVTSFLDPWQDPFGSGYQLTQSLMGFGRGGVFGEGLGNSIQKLGYLPEAHTDFVTAILGEETGFVGMCTLIAIELFIVCKAIRLSFAILRRDALFQGFVPFGIATWFFGQIFVNIGAAAGMLPTKGLTLPLVSYGGSSLMFCCAAIGILLRIDYEYRTGQISFVKKPIV